MATPSMARAREPKLQDDQGEALRRVEAYLRHEQQRRRLEGDAGRVERVVEAAGGAGGDACAPAVFAAAPIEQLRSYAICYRRIQK